MKVFDDYRSIQGLFIPFKQVVFRNDQKYTETEVLEAKFDDPMDDSLFEFPGLQARN